MYKGGSIERLYAEAGKILPESTHKYFDYCVAFAAAVGAIKILKAKCFWLTNIYHGLIKPLMQAPNRIF